MKRKVEDNKGLVIYADDDPDDLFLVSEAFLEHAPLIDLITVRDGVELFECLANLEERRISPCLIILDVNMPRMDGKAALKRLRTHPRYEGLPVVLFTTSCSNTDKSFAQHFNAGFVTKPLATFHFRPIIEAFFTQCSDQVKKRYGLPIEG
jgi:CheY-like chemotaxis protein